MSKLTPFDFINSINTSGPSLLKDCKADNSEAALSMDSPCKQYVPFIINRGLSQFNDTVLLANEMNMRHSLPAKMQYDFLKTTIRPRKRFTKWAKKSKDPADIKLIQQTYNYSREKAEQVYSLFNEAALKKLRKSLDQGGMKSQRL
jgi:hypothetical protein